MYLYVCVICHDLDAKLDATLTENLGNDMYSTIPSSWQNLVPVGFQKMAFSTSLLISPAAATAAVSSVSYKTLRTDDRDTVPVHNYVTVSFRFFWDRWPYGGAKKPSSPTCQNLPFSSALLIYTIWKRNVDCHWLLKPLILALVSWPKFHYRSQRFTHRHTHTSILQPSGLYLGLPG